YIPLVVLGKPEQDVLADPVVEPRVALGEDRPRLARILALGQPWSRRPLTKPGARTTNFLEIIGKLQRTLKQIADLCIAGVHTFPLYSAATKSTGSPNPLCAGQFLRRD